MGDIDKTIHAFVDAASLKSTVKITVDVDPIPLTREIAGDEAANQLEEALRNRSSE